MARVRKAVLPVAGLGTRVLPATKSIPKEMLPLIDRPLIQYAVEEALEAGIDSLVFISSTRKHTIYDHFSPDFELEDRLERARKTDLLHAIKDIVPARVDRVYVTQPEALGLGHAILCAERVIGDDALEEWSAVAGGTDSAKPKISRNEKYWVPNNTSW